MVFKGDGDFDSFGSWRVHRFCNDECGKLYKELNWEYDVFPSLVDDVLPALWEKWGVYKFLTASALVDQLRRKLLNLQFHPGDNTKRINNLIKQLAYAHAQVPDEIFDTFTHDDIKLENYVHHPAIKAEVSV